MARYDDGGDDSGGGDWFTTNAPPDDPQSGGGDPFADQINALYAKYGRSAPDAATIQAHRGNPGGIAAVEQLLKSDGRPQPGTMPTVPSGNSGPPTLNPSDPASRQAFINYYANQPGANPSLKNDPGYWDGKIASGELGSDPNYIIGKFMTPEGAPAGSAPSAPAGGSVSYGDFQGTPPSTYSSSPNAPAPPPAPTPMAPYVPPTWTGGPPPTAAQLTAAPSATPLTPFVAPTQAQLEASPGYQSRLAAGLLARNRSAAAQGSVLNGGIQQALARYGQDYASNEYGNLYGQDLALNQNNNAVTQTGNQNAFQGWSGTNAATQTNNQNALTEYLDRYGQFTDQANIGLSAQQQNTQQNALGFNQGQTSYGNRYQQYLDQNSRTLNDYLTNISTQRNSRNDYWTMLNNLATTGANAANGSYKPGLGA